MKLKVFEIKCLMAELGYNQRGLASASGITYANISMILSRGSCSLVTAGKLANALQVPVKDIVKED